MTSPGQALIGRRGRQVGAAWPGLAQPGRRGLGRTGPPRSRPEGVTHEDGVATAASPRARSEVEKNGSWYARASSPLVSPFLSRGSWLGSSLPAHCVGDRPARASVGVCVRACARAAVRGDAWGGRTRARSLGRRAPRGVRLGRLPPLGAGWHRVSGSREDRGIRGNPKTCQALGRLVSAL